MQLVVFPETTFTTFFPRYFIPDEAELESYYEVETENGIVDSPNVAPFFAHAKKLGLDVSIGYAEKTPEGTPYNTASYVSGVSGKVIGKYRKVHLPGALEVSIISLFRPFTPTKKFDLNSLSTRTL